MPNRLLMPNDAVVQADVRRPDGHGRRYEGHIVQPRDAHDERALREYGATSAATAGPHLAGANCPACGFASYFRRCSRCGTTREE